MSAVQHACSDTQHSRVSKTLEISTNMSSLTLEPGQHDLPSVMTILGHGQLLWNVLSDAKQTVKAPDGWQTIGCSRAAVRGSCRAMRNLFNSLITKVKVHLGRTQADEDSDATVPGFIECHGAWPAEQHAQHQSISMFLQTLPRLESLTCNISAGGASQVLQLLKEGIVPQSVTQLDIIYLW